MNKKPEDMDKTLQKTIDELVSKGITPKAAAYAAAMGYLRTLNNKKAR